MSAPRLIVGDTEQAVLAHARQGLTRTEIARRIGVSASCVAEYAARVGLTIACRPPALPEICNADLVRRYTEERQGVREIATAYGVCHTSVRMRLHALGVTMRPPSRAGAPGYPDKVRRAAQRLYERGEGAFRIAAVLGITDRVVRAWARRFDWRRPHNMRWGRDLVVPEVAVSRKPAQPIAAPTAWRCLDCNARVSDATACPNGHVAPWAVAA